MTTIISWILYAVASVFALSWVYGIRHNVNTGQGVTMQTVNTTFLFLVSLFIVPFLKISPFHIVWMFLASFILGAMSLIFPFSLISIFGNILASIVCIGLDKEAIAENQSKIKDLQQLMVSEGLTAEQAKEKLIEQGRW